jgi:predicted protein tyrosine phosphatase
MRVQVLNRYQAEECFPVPGEVMISISTPGDEPASLQEGWEDVLRLQFHDSVKVYDSLPDTVLFDREDAKQIHEFIAKHSEKDFVTHCDAGWSRSMAIGVFLRDTHGAQLQILSESPLNPKDFANFFANALVLRTLRTLEEKRR